MTDFKIKLEASIDISKIEQQLTNISKNFKFNISADTAGLDKIQQTITQIQNNSTSNKPIIDVEKTIVGIDEIHSRLAQIRQSIDQTAKVDIISNKSGEIVKATLSYTDGLGKSQKEVYKSVEVTNAAMEKTKQLQLQQTSYSQNIAKQNAQAQKILDAEVKSQQDLNKEFAKYQSEVDQFLAKSGNMNTVNPKVAGAINTANQLGGAIANQDIEATRKLGDEFKTAKASLVGLREEGHSWQEGMLSSIKTTIQYAASIGLVYGALAKIKEGVQYIIDLNKEMTNIQLVTGQTSDSLSTLALQYNRVAESLGSTTLQIAKTSTEFIRQGKTAEETSILIKNSTMLQKLGNLEAEDATKKLTATMNGFKIEAKDTGEIVDKLIKYVSEHIEIYGKLVLTKNKKYVIINF